MIVNAGQYRLIKSFLDLPAGVYFIQPSTLVWTVKFYSVQLSDGWKEFKYEVAVSMLNSGLLIPEMDDSSNHVI